MGRSEQRKGSGASPAAKGEAAGLRLFGLSFGAGVGRQLLRSQRVARDVHGEGARQQ
jgi:hypothetical protein